MCGFRYLVAAKQCNTKVTNLYFYQTVIFKQLYFESVFHGLFVVIIPAEKSLEDYTSSVKRL